MIYFINCCLCKAIGNEKLNKMYLNAEMILPGDISGPTSKSRATKYAHGDDGHHFILDTIIFYEDIWTFFKQNKIKMSR